MKLRRALVLCLAIAAAASARADGGIVLDPESGHVDVTTAFAGAEVAIYGAIEGAADIIIKITGPSRDVTMSREVQRGPFWISGGTAEVTGAPSIVYLYATRPIATLLPADERRRYGLDLEATAVAIAPRSGGISPDRWRRAFFRIKEGDRSYREDDRAIRITRNRLVTSVVDLPPEAEIGTYRIDALLVRAGKVVGHDTGHFEVRQVGVGAWVWRSAHEHAWAFGTACTFAAMGLGLALTAAVHRTT